MTVLTLLLVINSTYRCQFQKHFSRTFFADILTPKIAKLREALSFKILRQKCAFVQKTGA